MGMKEKLDAQHEYTLMEIRLSAEDVKEYVRQEIKCIDKRLSSLEHWRTFLVGGWAGIMAYFGFTK